MQLRKEGRRNEYERHKLQALNQRQKLVSFLCRIVFQRKESVNVKVWKNYKFIVGIIQTIIIWTILKY